MSLQTTIPLICVRGAIFIGFNTYSHNLMPERYGTNMHPAIIFNTPDNETYFVLTAPLFDSY
jgi:hypothetical protein